jgi:hypothetical protein
MAKKTVAQLEAQNEALMAKIAGLTGDLEHLELRIKHDYVEVAEYRRVQRVLATTQRWLAKYKHQAQGTTKPRLADQRSEDGLTAAQRAIREHRERLAS